MIFIKQIQKGLSFFVKNDFVSPELSQSNADSLAKSQKQLEQRDYSRFNPEQKTLIQNIEQKINELKAQLEALKVGEKVNGKAVTILTHGLKGVDDPEAANTKVLLSTYEKRLGEILNQKAITTNDLSKLQQELDRTLSGLHNTKESPLPYIDSKKLQSITNKEFLVKTPSERLAAITKNNVDVSKVVSGEVKNLEFTFTFDGVHNKDLYMKTTAGQVLPQQVGKVTVGGEEYSRQGLGGEFFNAKNRRLTIHEGTQLEIGEPRKAEEIEKIVKENGEKIKEYPNANADIVAEALRRRIDPNFANLAFKDVYEKTPDADRKIALEEMFTDFDRTRGYAKVSNELRDGKYQENLVVHLLMKYTPDNWRDKAKEYGFTEEKIKGVETAGSIYLNAEANAIQNSDSLPDGTYLKGEALLKQPEFSKKLDEVCQAIGAKREDLIKIMKAESGIDPRVLNGLGSGAVGLIQFMPKTAKGLGTSAGNLRVMTGVEQLDYVQKYFEQNSNGYRLDSIVKLYQVVFFPASLGKDIAWVFDAKDAPADKVAAQNGVIAKFSTRADGLIDGHAFNAYVENHVSHIG